MGFLRPKPVHVLLLLLPALTAEAGLQLELPECEAVEDWEPALMGVGLEAGPVAADQPPWARLVRQVDECTLEVSTSLGRVVIEPVLCPVTAGDREDVAALAAVMLHPMVTGSVSSYRKGILDASSNVDSVGMGLGTLEPQSETPGQVGSDSVRATSPPAPPSWTSPLSGSDMRPAGGAAETQEAEPPTTAHTGGLSSARQEGGPIQPDHAIAHPPLSTGTNLRTFQCARTGCSATFEGPCAYTEGCSTAEKCPLTKWQDKDHDGYGGQTCLSIESDDTVGSWVKNVGDCDDSHSSRHPGAEEIVGDGIDNNCDGVVQ